MSIIKKAESIETFRQQIRDLSRSNFPVWEMERITEFVAFAVAKLSPLQVGDTAELVKPPEIDESSGWWSRRHTLVAGKRGVVREIDWRDGVFQYLWEPENQTWISGQDGQERPVDKPSWYSFSETWLRKANDEPITG